jgi:hypothetical protein
MVAVEDPGAPGGVAGELDGRLDRLGPRIGEDDPLDAGMGPGHEFLGQQAGKQGAVQLGQVGKVGVERLVQRVLDAGVAPAQREHAEAGQQVQVPIAMIVDEHGALAAQVEPVEADGLQHLGHLGVHELGVELEVLTSMLLEQCS